VRIARNTFEHLLERTAKVGECVEWQGAISTSTGYGKVKFRGICLDAHRAMWIAANGQILHGLFVMHSCDNRKCVSLDHLSLGTPKDNMQDAARKGRIPPSAPIGEQSPKAKLSLADVVIILARLEAGENGTSVAADYPVDRSAISKIKRGISWGRALAAMERAA